MAAETKLSGSVEIALTSLAAGGDAVGRDPSGRVTFVPRGAPGDVVEVAIDEEHRSYARGTLQRVVAAGASRRRSPCAWFDDGPCGGCQWAHVADAAQKTAKQEIAAQALRRAIAKGLELRPLQTPTPPWGWRRRARLHVDGDRIGFFAPRTNRVVDLPTCPQLAPPLESALTAIRAKAPPTGTLSLLAADGAVVVATSAPWPNAEQLVGSAGIVGIVAGDTTHGHVTVELEPGLWTGADEFAQASQEGNAAIHQLLAEALPTESAPATKQRALELYAGAGNLTRVLLAHGWAVDAVEVAVPRRPLSHPDLRWKVAAAARWPSAFPRTAYQAVVLDPPRSGAKEVMATIARLRPTRVIYVSCDPATLARDLGRLIDVGGRPRWVTAIDTMPQTSHLELVAVVDLEAT